MGRRMKSESEIGLLSLEASISLTIFIMLMLFLYSFFVFFEARNTMAHALLQTANSLAMDSTQSEILGKDGGLAEAFYQIFMDNPPSSETAFLDNEMWDDPKLSDISFFDRYNGSIYYSGYSVSDETFKDDAEREKIEREFASAASFDAFDKAIKSRFLAYLGNGDSERAKELLKRYNIEGGIDGISFAGTKLVSGKLTLVITYTIDYQFNFWELGKHEMRQTACSKIWN